MKLSIDALVFGIGFLRSPKSKLSFGGDGAEYRITDRARAALNELLAAGYAESAAPYDQIPNREHYQGKDNRPSLSELARDAGLSPWELERWTAFEKIEVGA